MVDGTPFSNIAAQSSRMLRRDRAGQIVRLERMAHERSATIDFDKRPLGQSFNSRPADAVPFARCCRRFFYYLLWRLPTCEDYRLYRPRFITEGPAMSRPQPVPDQTNYSQAAIPRDCSTPRSTTWKQRGEFPQRVYLTSRCVVGPKSRLGSKCDARPPKRKPSIARRRLTSISGKHPAIHQAARKLRNPVATGTRNHLSRNDPAGGVIHRGKNNETMRKQRRLDFMRSIKSRRCCEL